MGGVARAWATRLGGHVMIVLPPIIAELFPAIMGFAAAFGGWRLAQYTKRHANSGD